MEQLQSKLHSYSLFGLPKVPQQLSFHQDSWEEGEEEETNLAMEDSWQMLLDDPQVQTRPEGRSGTFPLYSCVAETFYIQQPPSD